MEPRDDLSRGDVVAVRQKDECCKAGRGNAEAYRELLKRAGDGAGAAARSGRMSA